MTPSFALMEIDNNMLAGGLLVTLALTAAGFIGALATIKGWIREVAGVKETSTTEIAGQPLIVRADTRHATYEELRQLCDRVDNLDGDLKTIRADIARTREALTLEGSRRASSIHARVDNLATNVARLEERTETTNQTLVLLGHKIDRLVERS